MKLICSALTILLTGGLCGSLAAEENPFRLMIGASTNLYDSSIRVDADTGQVNRAIALEDQTNLDTQVSVGWLSGEWRFSPNHRVRFDYIPITRSGSRKLNSDLDFHNVSVLSDSQIRTDLTTNIYDVDYVYSFYSRNGSELGISLGFYVSDLEVELAAQGTIVSSQSGQTLADYKGQRDLTAPLPLAGLTYRKPIGKEWQLNLSGRVWDMDLMGIESSFYSTKASLEYQFQNDLAVGIACSYLDINLATDRQSFSGEIEISYVGAQIFFSAEL